MFSLLKLVIWIAGVLTVAYFVLGYFGYQVNLDYFQKSKARCEAQLKECGANLVRQGIDNASCTPDCIDQSIIINKKKK